MISYSLIVLIAADSLAFCLAVGFFVADKVKSSLAEKKRRTANLGTTDDTAEKKKAEREQREILNMLTYDGTRQDEFDS